MVFVGSSGTVPAPMPRRWRRSRPPEGGRVLCRSASSLPTPLCVRSFWWPRLLRVSARVRSPLSGLPLMGLSNGSSAVLPGSASRRPRPSPVSPVGPGSRPWSQPLASSRLPSPVPAPDARATARWIRPSIGISAVQPPSWSRGGHLSSGFRLPSCTPEGACAVWVAWAQRMPIRDAGVPSSSFLTTSTVSPHLTCCTSPRPRLDGSPRLRDLPSGQTRSRSAGSHRFALASPADLASLRASRPTRGLVVRAEQPIMGFIEFPVARSRGPHRSVSRPMSPVPSPRCTPAPRSLHSLPSRPLTLVAHLPCDSSLVSQGLHRRVACHSVHASTRPSRR